MASILFAEQSIFSFYLPPLCDLLHPLLLLLLLLLHAGLRGLAAAQGRLLHKRVSGGRGAAGEGGEDAESQATGKNGLIRAVQHLRPRSCSAAPLRSSSTPRNCPFKTPPPSPPLFSAVPPKLFFSVPAAPFSFPPIISLRSRSAGLP